MEKELTIREANVGDRQVIWEWWNDPHTRKMMGKNDYVPWEEHCEWFDKVLQDENRILCVGLVDSSRIGAVRFDLQEISVYDVSINLSPDHRGRGYAPRILVESINYLKTIREPAKLFAMLKKINIPSKKSFARAGFTYAVNPEPRYQRIIDFDPETEHYCELTL